MGIVIISIVVVIGMIIQMCSFYQLSNETKEFKSIDIACRVRDYTIQKSKLKCLNEINNESQLEERMNFASEDEISELIKVMESFLKMSFLMDSEIDKLSSFNVESSNEDNLERLSLFRH